MDSLHLKVISPAGTLLDATVSQVDLPGEIGPFTVLEGHAPLIAALRDGKLSYVQEGQEKAITIESGFAEVSDDEILVCID
ncbi:MAG: hypothetical protein ACRCSQ_03000 [Bacteroidales bacterium]